MSRFESHGLNTMVDLVEAGNPQALARAGEALREARAAFHEVSRELRGHLGAVDWKGEAHTEFRRFGGRLADHADDLGQYAGFVGRQLTEAATGLTSVRNSMPPRDATGGAAPSEPDRQEAVNQLNRLTSYYATTGSHLAAVEAPQFDDTLRTDVPRPKNGTVGGGASGSPGRGARHPSAWDTAPPASAGPSHDAAHPASAGPSHDAAHHNSPSAMGFDTARSDMARTEGGKDAAGATRGPELLGTERPAPEPPTTLPAAAGTPPVSSAPTTMELNSLASGPPAAPTSPQTAVAAPPLHPAPSPGLVAVPLPGTGPVPGLHLPGIVGGTPGGSSPQAAPTRAVPAYGPAPATASRPGFTATTSANPAPRMYGVIGGTPSAVPPAPPPARTNASSAASRGFTPGGTGLVRPGAPPPQPPPPPHRAPASRTPPRPQSRQQARHGRPTEDQDTWTAEQPTPVPPVVNHPPH